MIDVDELKARLDCREVVAGALGAPATRTRDYWMWCSPFRTERTPSFAVWQDHYFDFGGSNDSGDAIAFIQEYYGKSFVEACEYLGGASVDWKPAVTPVQVEVEPAKPISMEVVLENYAHIEEGIPYFNHRCISTPTSYSAYLGVKKQHYTAYTALDGTRYAFTALRYAMPNIFNGEVRAINYRRDDEELLNVFWEHPKCFDVLGDLEKKLGREATYKEIIDAIGGRKYEQEKGSHWRPFNVGVIAEVIDGKPRAKENLPYVLIHAETKEIDTLALFDKGYPTVGITLNREIEKTLPAIFAKVPMVYVIRDNDSAGLSKAESLVRAIGKGRIITPLAGHKDTGNILQANLLDKWLFGQYGLEPYGK